MRFLAPDKAPRPARLVIRMESFTPVAAVAEEDLAIAIPMGLVVLEVLVVEEMVPVEIQEHHPRQEKPLPAGVVEENAQVFIPICRVVPADLA